jgi:hypothetical protein
MSPYSTPSLDELLADPLIRAVMRADRVDAAALRRELARVAGPVARRRRDRALELGVAGARSGTEPRPVQFGTSLAPPYAGCISGFCG